MITTQTLLSYTLLSLFLCSYAVAQKHYQECPYSAHLDARFGCNYYAQDERVFSRLIGSFASFSKEHSVQFWLAHGTLLGLLWANKTLPYDDDIDLQMTSESITKLEQYHGKAWEYDDKLYLLDVNPNWRTYPNQDVFNIIDARWIDKSTGLFIDITVVHPCADGKPELCVRNHHRYDPNDIFPLVTSKFFGVEAFSPSNTEKILSTEYGLHCINSHQWRGYSFVKEGEKRTWSPIVANVNNNLM